MTRYIKVYLVNNTMHASVLRAYGVPMVLINESTGFNSPEGSNVLKIISKKEIQQFADLIALACITEIKEDSLLGTLNPEEISPLLLVPPHLSTQINIKNEKLGKLITQAIVKKYDEEIKTFVDNKIIWPNLTKYYPM